MSHVKLIVTDLDNTLLRRDKTISDYTIDVLRRVRERGIKVAFATARDFRYITEHLAPMFGYLPDIIVADNGAIARYDGMNVFVRSIPVATANALMKCVERTRAISSESKYIIRESEHKVTEHWSVGKPNTVVAESIDGVTEDVLFFDGTITDDVILAHYPNIRCVTYSDVNWSTFVHKEATKQNALAAVIDTLDISYPEIAAFGDDFSDVEMLRECGVGVAMSNAIDECKSVADYVCDDCDDDGAAHWIEENLL
ncbi:MAG: Cof-type HAD-IIB family hydrolase [Oscillospiraceae bacterium]|nr:Cof-type HAD-IIB family hydrolase [Oscillospiraceae bacterium]